MFEGDLRRLMVLRNFRRGRVSSYDRTGGNDDRLHIPAGKGCVIADIEGPGAITHIWMTLDSTERHYLREVVLRMFWDDEEQPSVETPIGDFFGAGNCQTRSFVSLPIQMSPENGRGFNCWFPMPFSRRARIEVENQCRVSKVLLYYYIDYEIWPSFPGEIAFFHAQWRRRLCEGKSEDDVIRMLQEQGEIPRDWPPDAELEPYKVNKLFLFGGKNVTGDDNYVILEAEGRGHYVGAFLYIHNMRSTNQDNWYGEGDDMIFIDGEPWPPSLHGTGTEDYFNTAWGPTQAYSAPYHGIILPGGQNFSGKIALYRFHIQDPIYFSKSIKVTIEHGHNNHRWDDLSSVAFWYQNEPHKPFPPLPSPIERLPFAD